MRTKKEVHLKDILKVFVVERSESDEYFDSIDIIYFLFNIASMTHSQHKIIRLIVVSYEFCLKCSQ